MTGGKKKKTRLTNAASRGPSRDGPVPADEPSGARNAPTRDAATTVWDWAKLVVACGMIGLVFGLVLPACMHRPQWQRRWERLRQQGIDPGAMYYTELEMMAGLLRELESPARATSSVRLTPLREDPGRSRANLRSPARSRSPHAAADADVP